MIDKLVEAGLPESQEAERMVLGSVLAHHAQFDTLAAALEAQTDSPALSQREIEVLELVARGLSNKQIAYSLEITETTAKNHVQHILQKLGAQDRTRATTVAIQRGIIHL